MQSVVYHENSTLLDRVTDPMLNPVSKSSHFGDFLNFGALLDIFIWSVCQNLCNLALVIIGQICINQKFSSGRTMALRGLTIGSRTLIIQSYSSQFYFFLILISMFCFSVMYEKFYVRNFLLLKSYKYYYRSRALASIQLYSTDILQCEGSELAVETVQQNYVLVMHVFNFIVVINVDVIYWWYKTVLNTFSWV